MLKPKNGDTVYIAGVVQFSINDEIRPMVRVKTEEPGAPSDTFLGYVDQIRMIESPEEETHVEA